MTSFLTAYIVQIVQNRKNTYIIKTSEQLIFNKLLKNN